eukprot:5343080-Prymnesium_polylepis.1
MLHPIGAERRRTGLGRAVGRMSYKRRTADSAVADNRQGAHLLSITQFECAETSSRESSTRAAAWQAGRRRSKC